MRIVIIGLSITSSWGNGHATTYRGLVRELALHGVDVVFAERDVPWYAENRDLPVPPYGTTVLYRDLADLQNRLAAEVRTADAVIVGSYVPEGVAVGAWVTKTARGVTAFYDIDTPVTLAKLERGDFEYLSPELICQYSLYLSFTGGPTLTRLEKVFGSPKALPLYCSVDPTLYYPEKAEPVYDLGYMGTYSPDRQPPLEELLLEPARRLSNKRFIVAGPQYPQETIWPANVERIEHLPPANHRAFYNSQHWTLNITRSDMKRAGWSPSVRLFEAAACGVPIISDRWQGIEEVLTPGKEVILVDTADEVEQLLLEITDTERQKVSHAARERVLSAHTAAHRAAELVSYLRTESCAGS